VKKIAVFSLLLLFFLIFAGCKGDDNSSSTVNTAEPDTTISSKPSDPSNSEIATFEFSSTETNSIFECKINGSSWEICTSPKTYTNLLEGNNSFEVRAVNKGRKRDLTPAVYTWMIDTTEPDTSISSKPDTS